MYSNMRICIALDSGSSPFLKGLKISDACERSKKVRKYERKLGRDGLGYPASARIFPTEAWLVS
jgi:hypothetical protein